MGQALANWFMNAFKNKKAKILLIGLAAAGKTTILYKLKLDEDIVTIPTIGFNVETVQYHNINFTMWDIGGQDKIRDLWKHYYTDTDAIIYVVDSNDKENLPLATKELHRVMEADGLRNANLLILANKQDLPHALNADDLFKQMKLRDLKQKNWFIQPCNAPHGQGLYEGLDWLSQQLK